MRAFKVVVTGSAETGKTSFVQRLLDGSFPQDYSPTHGVDVHGVIVKTSHGSVCLNFWDCAGQDRYRGLGDGYYINADAALIFVVSETEKVSWTLEQVRRSISRPVILVQNKMDSDPEILWAQTLAKAEKLPYHQISVKDNFSLDLVLLRLIRSLLRDESVRIM